MSVIHHRTRFLRGVSTREWFRSSVIASESEVRMNSISFQSLRELLSKEALGSQWFMGICFLNLARSLIADRLPVFIDLARISVSNI